MRGSMFSSGNCGAEKHLRPACRLAAVPCRLVTGEPLGLAHGHLHNTTVMMVTMMKMVLLLPRQECSLLCMRLC